MARWNVKLIIDDNDVTIAGHPSEYLAGHGMKVLECNGEDIDALYKCITEAIKTDGSVAVIYKRPMCSGIEGLEGLTHGHDVVSVKVALEYLESHNQQAAADVLRTIEASKQDKDFK